MQYKPAPQGWACLRRADLYSRCHLWPVSVPHVLSTISSVSCCSVKPSVTLCGCRVETLLLSCFPRLVWNALQHRRRRWRKYSGCIWTSLLLLVCLFVSLWPTCSSPLDYVCTVSVCRRDSWFASVLTVCVNTDTRTVNTLLSAHVVFKWLLSHPHAHIQHTSVHKEHNVWSSDWIHCFHSSLLKIQRYNDI